MDCSFSCPLSIDPFSVNALGKYYATGNANLRTNFQGHARRPSLQVSCFAHSSVATVVPGTRGILMGQSVTRIPIRSPINYPPTTSARIPVRINQYNQLPLSCSHECKASDQDLHGGDTLRASFNVTPHYVKSITGVSLGIVWLMFTRHPLLNL